MMRIIGLGLLAFLLTGTTLAVSRADFVKNGIASFKDTARNTQLIFEPDTSDQTTAKGEHVAFLRSGAVAPLILSGLPAFGSAKFSLPITARPQSGYLKIDTTMQTLAGVEGLMRISIDNTRRGEVLLVPGLVSRSVKIPLTSKDLSGEALNVSFSLIGTGSTAGCTSDEHLAIVAEIEPSSALILALDGPLQTNEDQVIAWGDDLRIEWPQDLSPQDRADRIAISAMLKRQGASVSFHENDGFGIDALSSLLASAGQSGAATEPGLTFPVALAEFSGNAGARDFKRRTTWRARYTLDESTSTEFPGHIDLNLRLGSLPADENWTISAKLNGRLLVADMLDVDARNFISRLELPTEYQGRTNVIEISATSSQELQGECNNGPDLIAELTENSVLLGSGQSLTGPLSDLRAALAQKTTLGVRAAETISNADTAAFVTMIAAVAPVSVTLQGGVETTDITLLTRAETAALATSRQADETAWIVTSDEVLGTLQVVRGTSEALEELAARAPLALLIRPVQ